MVNTIKSRFSIKDIENLSGVKAHTIRIWEKRYTLFEPKRTETNIRYYTPTDLKKILNVSFLVEKGMKISKISNLSIEELRETVVLEISKSATSNSYENSILYAMINFDKFQFETIYNQLSTEFSFREIFNDLFIPLLNKIGLQWQSSTITPAHEHFISNLIYQKLYVNIEKVNQSGVVKTDKTFVLFLPMNETHELGLLYLEYELSLKGYKTIYLGDNVPVKSLESLNELYSNIVYLSYFTVYPIVDTVEKYLIEFKSKYLQKDNKLWVLGRNTSALVNTNILKNITIFKNINEVVKAI
jgi:DNA-binding transcriptional MerR regulator